MAYGDPRPDDNDPPGPQPTPGSGEPSAPQHWMDDKSWIGDKELEALNMERALNPEETEEQMANRLIRSALPLAIQSLIKLAVHSVNDRIRLEASRYIIERNMGKLTDTGSAQQIAPWEDLLADTVSNEPAPY